MTGPGRKSIANLEEHFPGVPLEDQKRIARDNVIKLYGLTVGDSSERRGVRK